MAKLYAGPRVQSTGATPPSGTLWPCALARDGGGRISMKEILAIKRALLEGRTR
ncbi:MAG: hypothetical protein IT513_07950 [Burkholderiales bacterium]|nr:hypothetical protein [Burkholderiales bacterium]